MLLKKSILLILSFVLSFHLFPQNNNLFINKKEINVGVYVEAIYGIDYKESKFEIVFWIWVNSDHGIYDFENGLDIPYSTFMDISAVIHDSTDQGRYHSECKIKAVVLNKFDVKNFPFDKQNINLNIEFADYSNDEILISIDENQSKFTPEYIQDWITKDYKVKIVSNDYGSNFGDLHINESINYPSVEVKVNLERNAWNLYFKSFLTLVLAFALAVISLFYPNDHSEEKIGLIVGSLFTTVGNKYVADDMLPIQSTLNLSDKLHLLTILTITIVVAYSIFEQRLKLKDSFKIDLIVFFIFLSFFTFGFVYFTLDAF